MSGAEKLSWRPGKPYPLGPSRSGKGINFALFAPNLKEISLGLFSRDKERPEVLIHLDPKRHFTNGIWHVHVDSPPKEGHYAYKIGHTWVVDPYAKELRASKIWGIRRKPLVANLPKELPFDWEGVVKPGLSMEELFVYEMHVRGFTQDSSSHTKHPGTFLGIIEKIPYLLDLGVNAVELMPIFSFNETLHHHEGLCNYWGYSTEHFFFPMAPYGSPNEFKELVKQLHRAGIEVILDVVYNHVGSPWYATLAKSSYFLLDKKGHHTNFTGCGNTVQTNHPQVMHLILESLRYYAREMQVDGFRFDLAPIFCRDADGAPLENPPIVEAICEDPLLEDVKLIAEPWDCGGLYLLGAFPRSDRIAQWNGQFRDTVRKFIKGTEATSGDFARVMAGSTEFQSINFVTAHDGFTLRDLVSYNEKHNESNGEEGQDGNPCNESWNCGIEGETDDPNVHALRLRQMKNFILALCFSAGTPMMLMGDEYGHSRKGNNNAYCQDNVLNYFLWNQLEESSELFAFFKQCIALRKTCKPLVTQKALEEPHVTWHMTNWEPTSRLVAFEIHDDIRDFFLCFNAHSEGVDLSLPSEKKWKRIVDTSLPEAPEEELDAHYYLAPYSSLLILT